MTPARGVRVALVVWLVVVVALIAWSRSRTPSNCATIHKPADGCPAGYREVADVFERDGKKSPACVSSSPRKTKCVDELRPRESINIGVPVPADEPKRRGRV